MASNKKKEEPNTAPQPDRWFNLTLGSSFKDHYPSSKFCTLRLLHKNKENRVTVEFHNNQPGKPKVMFEGSSEDYKENDAVLFFDGEGFWLERLHRAVKRLRHVRLPGESAAAAAGTSLGPAVEATSPPTSKVARVQTLNKSIRHSMPPTSFDRRRLRAAAACSGGERLRSPRYKTQYVQINCAFYVSKGNLKNMSNSIGHNLIHHNLLALVVLEHQSRINSSCISGYNLFQVQANSQIRKSHITSKSWGKCLNLRKTKLPMGTNRVLSVFPQSVLATNPTSKVVVSAPTSGSVSEIDMQVTNTSGTLVLHWGGIQKGKEPVDYEPPFFRNCTEQEAHSPWTKKPLKIERVKSMLDPCEDENDDIQDDDVSLGADFVQRDEHSESVSEYNQYIVAPIAVEL
ncbi:unnamed protein product [Camellia sinensis]